MSIFGNIFGGAQAPTTPTTPAPAQQAPTLAAPGNIPDQQVPAAVESQGTAPNGTVPNAPVTTNTASSPLDAYKDLWQTKPTDKSNLNPAPTGLDPKQLEAAMAKADFSSAMNPDIMAAIAAGGEDASAAFMTAMSNVARQSMTQSTLINEKLTAQAVQQAIAAMEARIPNLVKDHSSASHVQDSNPMYSNPALKPVIDATRTQLLNQYPNDTPAQTTAKLNDYLKVMAETFNPAPAPVAPAGETDWNKYLSM